MILRSKTTQHSSSQETTSGAKKIAARMIPGDCHRRTGQAANQSHPDKATWISLYDSDYLKIFSAQS